MQNQQNTPSRTEFKNALTQATQAKKKAVSLAVLAQEFPLGAGETHSSGTTLGLLGMQQSRTCSTIQPASAQQRHSFNTQVLWAPF